MKHVFVVLKGILFGIANLIPGVSGGTMAVISGVYEKLIKSINNLFKQFKESILFLIPYGIGVIIAVLFGSKALGLLLKYLALPTSFLFVGLVAGGIPSQVKPICHDFKNKTNIIVMCVAILAVIALMLIPIDSKSASDDLSWYNYILLFLCGFLASVAMVVPGISGMLMFMLFGYYDLIINTLGSLTNFSLLVDNILVILPIMIGVVFGIFTAAKLISFFLHRFPKQTYFAILGFVLASIVCIFFEADYSVSWWQYLIGAFTLPLGFFASFYLARISKPEIKA